MPGKRTPAQEAAPFVRLGLVDKPDGRGASLDPRLANAVATLKALGKDLDLDLRLTARHATEPGEAEAAWLETWESLGLSDQVHALQLSGRFGPARIAAGKRILEREAHAAAVEADLRAWVAARGGDPTDVEVFYNREDATYDVSNGQTCMRLDHLNDYGIEAAFERMRDIVPDK